MRISRGESFCISTTILRDDDGRAQVLKWKKSLSLVIVHPLCRRRFYIETTFADLLSLLTTNTATEKESRRRPSRHQGEDCREHGQGTDGPAICSRTEKLWHWQRHDAENAVKQIREMAEIRSHSKTTTSVEEEIASAAGD